MNASQQHLFDAYRAAQHGTPTPPAPGRHDWETVRELRDTVRDDLRFRAVVAERPAGAYLRAAFARLADRFRTSRFRMDRFRTDRSGARRAVQGARPARPRTADCN
ncbi:hypothetical protein OG897_39175 [Streptomyces sp. NBC_00237]|uniref:hypothetical protein n=1 Tax=Streptomyces sp. NBC_00237 TaxID=2975687 RepID=UPI00225537A3|nr:hypothetical protein [Streptomyces sp. NBC_00237]MCX5207413.1 hypothetical protein [Streptomyces sp. NBC_00237]